MKWRGTLSTFGGPTDSGMVSDSGLTIYEAHEADRAEPLFHPGPANVPTWKRLRTEAFYIALPFMGRCEGEFRRQLQAADFRVCSEAVPAGIVARIVDRGPHHRTGRLVDMSPGLEAALGVRTDDEVEVELCSPVDGFSLDPRNKFSRVMEV